jgi:hypothetical protein
LILRELDEMEDAMRRWSIVALWLIGGVAHPSPCTGIDRTLTDAQKRAWAPVIAKQLHVANVDVLQVFRDGDWRVIYVDTHVSDNGFLFYRDDPLHGTYVNAWAGAAMKDEEASIHQWVQKNVPGIPAQLAICFAWHVTQDRDM